MKIPKIVSKFYRLKLTDKIRDLVMKLSTRNLQETQIGNHIYYAKGQIEIGSQFYPGRIRVWFQDKTILVSIKSDGAEFQITCPFNSEYEQSQAPQIIKRALRKHIN